MFDLICLREKKEVDENEKELEYLTNLKKYEDSHMGNFRWVSSYSVEKTLFKINNKTLEQRVWKFF